MLFISSPRWNALVSGNRGSSPSKYTAQKIPSPGQKVEGLGIALRFWSLNIYSTCLVRLTAGGSWSPLLRTLPSLTALALWGIVKTVETRRWAELVEYSVGTGL